MTSITSTIPDTTDIPDDEMDKTTTSLENAVIQNAQGNYPLALETLSHVFKEAGAAGDTLSCISAACGIGDTCIFMDNPLEAATSYRKALELWRTLGGAERIVVKAHIIMANLGEVLMQQGLYAEAVEAYEGAKREAKRRKLGGMERGRATNNLGDALMAQNKLPEALTLFHESLNWHTSVTSQENTEANQILMANALQNIAWVYRLRDNPHDALDLLEAALQIKRSAGANDADVRYSVAAIDTVRQELEKRRAQTLAQRNEELKLEVLDLKWEYDQVASAALRALAADPDSDDDDGGGPPPLQKRNKSNYHRMVYTR